MGRYFNEYFQALGGYFRGQVVIRLLPQTVYYYVPGRESTLSIGRVQNGEGYLFWQVTDPSEGLRTALLGRRVGVDDYVRWAVPDTRCPVLPSPDSPLDSGKADEAEPERWIVSGDVLSGTGSGWQFPAFGGSVRTNYSCYAGGDSFRVEAQVDHSAVGRHGVLVGPTIVSGDWPVGYFLDLVYLQYGSCLLYTSPSPRDS